MSTFRPFSDKQRRAYRKIYLGIRKRRNKGVMRFLTLGTPLEYKGTITKDFVKLKKRYKRLTVKTLLDQGYLSKTKARYYYGLMNYNQEFKINYCKIKTSEGPNGVLHILFFGYFIPQKWLYDNWKEITKVEYLANQSVDIRMCESKIKDTRKLTNYCVNQYLKDQEGFVNSSVTWNWCYRGFIGEYNELTRRNRKIDYEIVMDLWDRRVNDKDQTLLELNYSIDGIKMENVLKIPVKKPDDQNKEMTVVYRTMCCECGVQTNREILGEYVCWDCYKYDWKEKINAEKNSNDKLDL